ncbi:MAG: Gfo/Idh/MocA family oxidoreductase [Clostridia bacterium]|nr:Gfo/Idh/MocA family oxidoreductase [Clostridia bacterium]
MLSAAIIGTGFAAEIHARTLHTLGIEIKAVVSRTEDSAARFAAKWNIPTYGTELSAAFCADVIHICTPPSLHFAQASACLQEKKHVVCEKPLCLDVQQAQTLCALAESAGTVCAVCFNSRFYAAIPRLKEICSEEDFGRPVLIHGSYLQEFGAMPCKNDWRYQASSAGKMHAVTELGSHLLDLLQYLSGRKITSVCAQFDRFHPVRYLDGDQLFSENKEGRTPVTVNQEDAAILNLRFSDGAIGVVTLSELSHGRQNRLSVEITGENASVWWNSEDASKLYCGKKGWGVREEQSAFSGGYFETHLNLFTAVYTAIRENRREGYPTFKDGAQNASVCEAAYDSAMQDAKWVQIDN